VAFITIATSNFLPLVRRLAVSLRKSGNHQPLVVYCDDEHVFAPLARSVGCEVRELPEIRRLGVKRAKFTAYTNAHAEFGGFAYLDADIIVLAELREMFAPDRLRAAPDNLSACSFIADRRRPWPGDPSLVNEIYVNSGVLSVPPGMGDFLQRLRDNSARDELWERYVIPGKLYDNHFLCAYLNIEKVDIDPLDPEQYNWQGFVQNGELRVLRRGDTLVNKQSGKPLKLAHFAGIGDVDRALCQFPVAVASLLCEQSTERTGSPAREFTQFQASLSRGLQNQPTDEFATVVFDNLRRETLALAEGGWSTDYGSRQSYFSDPDAMLSLQYSRPNSKVLWNGLQCGGSYLEGDEYNFLARLVKHAGIKTALEIGAGETSICLHREGVDVISVESAQGPWLERAKAAGCRAAWAPFLEDQAEFEPAALERAVAGAPPAPDVIFIDSPVGTRSRSRVLTQLLAKFTPRLVLFHDVHRDATNLFAYQLRHDLRLADYLPSRRGMVLFALGGAQPDPMPRLSPGVILDSVRCRLSVRDTPEAVAPGEIFRVTLTVENQGESTLSSRYRNPVHASYHWLDRANSVVVHDGLRTLLPFDLYPCQSAEFPIELQAPSLSQRFRARVTLVQESVSWFDGPRNDSWCDFDVDVRPRQQETKEERPLIADRAGEGDGPVRQIPASLHIVTADMEDDPGFLTAYRKCKEHTITSMERMYAMWQSVRYVSARGLAGDIVECGVWMGGNCMLAALALQDLGDAGRRIWLYDTFEGMARPSSRDVRHDGQDASALWEPQRTGEQASTWWSAPVEAVCSNMASTGYPGSAVEIVKGRVQDTIPGRIPQSIAVLRLDTDWYESTRHEMIHLFPRLSPGGVLILDDYGWWRGSRQAVDEMLVEMGFDLLLARIDSSGARLAIKL